VTPARCETFADGVFAIAATLLILNVDSQVGDQHGPVGDRLLHIWPSYLAYGVSFLTIGIMWINHHTVLNLVEHVDRRFLLANVLLLMCIAFVPFPTRLVAEHVRDEGARSAALVYGFSLTVTAICFSAVWFYAALGKRLLRPDADPKTVAGISRSYLPGPGIYLVSTLIAFASSTASVVLFASITAFYIVDSSIFGGRA
jgi:uncharacterized membrane protein